MKFGQIYSVLLCGRASRHLIWQHSFYSDTVLQLESYRILIPGKEQLLWGGACLLTGWCRISDILLGKEIGATLRNTFMLDFSDVCLILQVKKTQLHPFRWNCFFFSTMERHICYPYVSACGNNSCLQSYLLYILQKITDVNFTCMCLCSSHATRQLIMGGLFNWQFLPWKKVGRFRIRAGLLIITLSSIVKLCEA